MELRPATAVRIYDYTPDPRALLRELHAPLDDLRSFVRPMVNLRRGWLHGSHLAVTVRPHLTAPEPDIAAFGAAAAAAAARLPAAAPPVTEYLAHAEQLAPWENVEPPFLPLHPQGQVTVEAQNVAERWSTELQLARDLIATGFVDGVLAAASADIDVAHFAARVLALLARVHPYGLSLGTLSYRSHAEGVAATVRGSTDLGATFARQFERDRDFFTQALVEGEPGAADPLTTWTGALHRAWGIGEALAASGAVDGPAIDTAGRLDRMPVEQAGVSDFHAVYSSVGLAAQKPHWFTAHRLVLNCVYTSLMCLGLSPLQRYYVCYGLAEATDALLDDPWRDRLDRLGATAASLTFAAS